MPWTGWLVISVVVAGWLAIQFSSELFKVAGTCLDRLSPRLAAVLLALAILVIALLGIMIPAGRMRD